MPLASCRLSSLGAMIVAQRSHSRAKASRRRGHCLIDSVVELLGRLLLRLDACGRRPVLSIACAYGTFLYTPVSSKYFISSRRTSATFFLLSFSYPSSSHRLVLIFAQLIFCACMDCLAKHGCPTCAVLNLHVCFLLWMMPAARTSLLFTA